MKNLNNYQGRNNQSGDAGNITNGIMPDSFLSKTNSNNLVDSIAQS